MSGKGMMMMTDTVNVKSSSVIMNIVLESVHKLCGFLEGEFGPPIVINGFPYAFIQCYGVVHVVDLEGSDELTDEIRRILLIAVSQHAHWRHSFDNDLLKIERETDPARRCVAAKLLIARQRQLTDDRSLLKYFVSMVGEETAVKIVAMPPEIKNVEQIHDAQKASLLVAALKAWRIYGQILFAEASMGAYQRFVSTAGEEEFKAALCGILDGLDVHENQQAALMKLTIMRRQVEVWKTYAHDAFKTCLATYVSGDPTKLSLMYQIICGQDQPEKFSIDTVSEWIDTISPATDTVGMWFVMNLIKRHTAADEEKGKTKKNPSGDYDYHEAAWCLFTLLSTVAPKGTVPPCKVNDPGVSVEEYIVTCFQQYGDFYRWCVGERPVLHARFAEILGLTQERLYELTQVAADAKKKDGDGGTQRAVQSAQPSAQGHQSPGDQHEGQ
ncbi:protein ORF85 [Cyprinid herpesvirus 2]|nr:protein ORF85 [Cyprinid herpesvirus 2]